MNTLYGKIKAIALSVSIAVIIYFLVQIGTSTYIGWKQNQLAKEAKITYENNIVDSPEPSPVITANPGPSTFAEPIPPTETEKIIRSEFNALIKQYENEDIVGYLKIEDTTIDYPVLQYSDNDYYLHKDIHKNYSLAGSLFLDYENNIIKEDQNTIIYGHNMNQDIMFHSLRRYREKDFYDTHKYITFHTLYDDYVYEIFSYYITDISFYYLNVNFPTEDTFMQLVTTMLEKSAYDTGVSIGPEDRILTLSTCSNVTDDTRIVVNAKLVSVNGRDYEDILLERADYEKALEAYNAYIETLQPDNNPFSPETS